MLRILSYISIIFITFVFTYVFDIKENYMMLYMLIIAPIFDYILFLINKKNVFVKSLLGDEFIEKRESINCEIEIINDGLLPIVFIDYEFTFNEKFICSFSPRERISIGGRRSINKEFSLRAIHRGIGQVQLTNVEIKSVMGLFKGKIPFESSISKVTITPALVDVDGINNLIDITVKDETEDEVSNDFWSGDPGSEYKSYVPGDPLNRVNWKLSSKVGELYIRKSATDIRRKKMIIIDPLITNKNRFEDYGDLLIEGMIGIARELYTLDYCTEVYYLNENHRHKFKFESIDLLPMLLEKFSIYDFQSRKLKNRFSKFVFDNDESCDFVILTTNNDKELEEFAFEISHNFHSVTIISNDKLKIFENQLYISENYRLEVI